MLILRNLLDKSIDLGAYVVSALLLSGLALWSVSIFGLTTISMMDQTIIDGSGQQVGPRERPHLAAPVIAEAPAALPPKVAATPAPVAQAIPIGTTRVYPISRTAVSDIPEDDPAAEFHDGTSSTYRTYCVRLCDGYYWPISYSTSTENFDRDEAACTASCGTPAKLFVHPMPGGGAGTMISRDGLAYTALRTAFLFRTRYDAACTCRGQPWQTATEDRHRLYAAMEQARKGDKRAVGQVRELSAKVEENSIATARKLALANAHAERELKALANRVGTSPLPVAAPRRPNSPPTKIASAPVRRSPGYMGLGFGQSQTEAAPRSRSGWKPATGSARNWRERVFSAD